MKLKKNYRKIKVSCLKALELNFMREIEDR